MHKVFPIAIGVAENSIAFRRTFPQRIEERRRAPFLVQHGIDCRARDCSKLG
jgi:hypothetical protein